MKSDFLSLSLTNITRQLLPENLYAEHCTASLLAADTRTRWETYRTARESMIMTTNEIRRRENMEPVEGGDLLVNPNTFSPTDRAAMNAAGGGA